MTSAAESNRGPLADLRVIEMGTLLAGPFCGQLLGDFGAEVIKVEPPNQGDPMREWGREKAHGMSLWWPIVARNKKSVTLNLREAQGQAIARDLVAKADFLLENFRPGTLEKWNLGWEDLRKVNPRLIMIRVSGFGQDGPYSRRAGFGAVGEAMGGLRYVCGDPSTPPSRMGISIGDSLAATFACLGALSALHYREKTGEGQVVDSAIYEAVLNMMESLVTEYDKAGYVRERTGAILPNVAPSNVYPTRDAKFILIAANQDTVFGRLAEAMGQPELARDPRYATHTARGARQRELDDLIARWTCTVDAERLENLMDEFGIPSGKIYRTPEMLEDAHFRARQAIVNTAHPVFGQLRMQNVAPKLSVTPGGIRSPAPDLGQHNDDVYRGLLGYNDGRMNELRVAGIMSPGPIVGVTIAAPDLAATEAAYTAYLGYRVVSRAPVTGEEAARWRRPALAGRATLVMSPIAGDDFRFRFVASPRRPYRAFAGHGWNAAEIIVADVDALARRLGTQPFELVGAPQDLSFSDAIRAMQVRGPSGEILYLTQFKREIPGLPVPPARSDVDRVFIVIAGGASLDALLGFYGDRFGIPRPPAVESRVKAMSAALGLSPEHRYPIAAVPLVGNCYIEADEMPAGAAPVPEDALELPPGIAMVTLEADVAEPTCLRGVAGELLELVPRTG